MNAFSEDQYADMLMRLLPQGAAWPRDAESNLVNLFKGLATESARLDATAHALLTELDPPQSLEMLSDWETMCGLPDECSQLDETVAERREAVVMALSSSGGQTPEYIAELATLAAGELCTVEEISPLSFAIHASAVIVSNFRVGSSVSGERLRRWGNERLECIIERVKPAHTEVLFKYGE